MSDLRVVINDRMYEVERPWGQTLKGTELEWVSDVAVDSHGNVYVLQRTSPPVVVFDSGGGHIRSWGACVLTDPHAIFITQQDVILIVDRDAHEVIGFDGEGHVLLKIGRRHRPRWAEPFNHPTDAAVSADGDIFVCDGYANARVHRFSYDGELAGSWGAPGSGEGQFMTPHAVWVDRSGRVLVADRDNDRIQVFDNTGHYLDQWCDVYHPMDLWENGDGVIFVSDQVPRLSGFSTDGVLMSRCRPVLFGDHGLWGAADGSFFLAEHAPMNRITRLVPTD